MFRDEASLPDQHHTKSYRAKADSIFSPDTTSNSPTIKVHDLRPYSMGASQIKWQPHLKEIILQTSYEDDVSQAVNNLLTTNKEFQNQSGQQTGHKGHVTVVACRYLSTHIFTMMHYNWALLGI